MGRFTTWVLSLELLGHKLRRLTRQRPLYLSVHLASAARSSELVRGCSDLPACCVRSAGSGQEKGVRPHSVISTARQSSNRRLGTAADSASVRCESCVETSSLEWFSEACWARLRTVRSFQCYRTFQNRICRYHTCFPVQASITTQFFIDCATLLPSLSTLSHSTSGSFARGRNAWGERWAGWVAGRGRGQLP